MSGQLPMANSKARGQVSRLRKVPTQERSAQTVALIVETAAQLLEQHGLEGFNTNAIAQIWSTICWPFAHLSLHSILNAEFQEV